MARQRTRDTKPEIDLRRALYRRGLRFRLHRGPLATMRANVDINFRSDRVAVQVHGCFWHGCAAHRTLPRANSKWWAQKLARNAERDALVARALASAGWQLIVVWEHDNPGEAAARIADTIQRRRMLAPGGAVHPTGG